MDNRDEHQIYPHFHFLVYAGGELSQGSVCGAITGSVLFTPAVTSGDRVLAEKVGCGVGRYHFAFKPRAPKELPCFFEATFYSGVAWCVAHLLERLGAEYPRMGPYLAIPCSPMEGFW